jgi:hypothetical protein
VSKHASEQDIRKAYKRLSKQYHPDKNTDPGAEEKFVDIAHGKSSCTRFHRMASSWFYISIRSPFRLHGTQQSQAFLEAHSKLFRNAKFMIGMVK